MDAGTGTIVIVAYRPKPGKEADLLQLTREHLPILRAEGLATNMPATVMQAKDGTILEVFEWAPGGLEKAHTNAAVGAMWGRYWQACDVMPLNSLPEAAGDVRQLHSRHPLELSDQALVLNLIELSF